MARIPLQPDLKPRDSTAEKDSRMVNGVVEKSATGIVRSVKRAGILSEIAGAGIPGQGIFSYGGNVYVWDTSTTPLGPLVVPTSGMKRRVVVSDTPMADDQYRFVTLYPNLFDAWHTGDYFLGSSIPLTAGSYIDTGTSATSPPVTVVGGSTFTYRAKVNVTETTSGTSSFSATLTTGGMFTLVNTYDLGSTIVYGSYNTATRLFFVTESATAADAYYTDTPESGGLTNGHGDTTLAAGSAVSIYDGSAFYNFYKVFGNDFLCETTTTPYVSWVHGSSGTFPAYYNSAEVVLLGGGFYGVPNGLMANGLKFVTLPGAVETTISTSGLPSTGYCTCLFRDTSNLYLVHASTSTVYKSSDSGVTWALFGSYYKPGWVRYVSTTTFVDGVVYILLSDLSVITFPDGGTGFVEGVSDITDLPGVGIAYYRLCVIGGVLYCVEVDYIESPSINYTIKIWKKTG